MTYRYSTWEQLRLLGQVGGLKTYTHRNQILLTLFKVISDTFKDIWPKLV